MASPGIDYDGLVRAFLESPRIALLRTHKELGLRNLLRLHEEFHASEESFKKALSARARVEAASGSENPRPGTDLTAPPEMTPDLQQLACIADQKLRDYYAFLLQFTQIQTLAPPEDVDVQSLLDHFPRAAQVPQIEDTPWSNQDDVIGVFTTSHRKRDRLSKWITKRLGKWSKNNYFRAFIKSLPSWISPITERYDDGSMDIRWDSKKFSSCVALSIVIIGSSINVFSMYALYAISNMEVRFAVIWVFTVVFSSAMMLLTPTDTINMLTALAAYSAVLVVFVGSTTT